ncbi:TonB-dependent receptor [Salipiger aestuarii]|uniref:Hemoglobin/transferrin/lactoferrin receptor protein n=1 Tax=Salipiger aestuarii TaxID=568098 RepID=A0A327Y4I2_9RHOB|nr:TonB-dependent receptor [Salipiger aestuarii]KAB2541119.1 TonB-dependent receptor [Salipiger aestuarii]RAK13299.1 hemoglobin/transferrin/lactoferrin receptor protein [Salipiger aestuarii]
MASQIIRTALLAGTATGALGTAPAAAQDSTRDTGGYYELDPLYFELRDPQAGAADRATSMYVSGFELERARTGDLKDLFAGIASVSVGGAIPVAQKIFVNGVDMLNLGVTIDGTAQNNRTFHHTTANAIDPGLLQEVRVDATVSPADAGPYALAGSVVMETVDPESLLGEGRDFGGNLRLSYGDNGETFQRALTVSGRTGGLSMLGYARRATGEDYTTGAGDEMGGTAADLDSWLGKVAYQAPTGPRLEFSAHQIRDDARRQFRANFGGNDDFLRGYDTTRSSYSLRYENTAATGLWDPSVHLGYSESDVIIPDPYDSNGLSWTGSATLMNTFNLASGTVNAGYDYRERFGEYDSPAYAEYQTEHSRTHGVFAQARLDPTERLTLSFGARYDWQEFEGVTGKTVSQSGASGNLSASYALTDGLTLRGGVSSIFGGIDIEDNYTYFAFTDPFDYGTLDASRARSATVGLDWQRGSLKLGGEVFVTAIDDARGGGENFDFESKGFNLGASFGWDSGFARFTLSRSNGFIDGDRAESYALLDFGAPLGTVMAFEIEQDTRVDGLRVGGGLDAAAPHDMPSGLQDLDGYGAVNLFAEYVPQQTDSITLRAEVQNLFDAEYADRGTYGGDYAGFETLKEPGRTLSLVAVARF